MRVYKVLIIIALLVGCSDIHLKTNDIKTSIDENWINELNLSDAEQKELIDRREKILTLRKNGLPIEIDKEWAKILEDAMDFFEVTELPFTEIKDGVYSWFPSEYLVGKKNSELSDFLSPRIKELYKLYEKHGLKENFSNKSDHVTFSQGPPGGPSNFGSIASVYVQGSNTYTLYYAWTSANQEVVGVSGYTTGLGGYQTFDRYSMGYIVEYLGGTVIPTIQHGCVFISSTHYIGFSEIGGSNDMDCT